MNTEKSKTPLALMEEIIMILVFAVAAAFCVKAFVYSRQQSIDMTTRDKAVNACKMAIEEMKAEGYIHEDVYYDGNWNESCEKDGRYVVMCEEATEHTSYVETTVRVYRISDSKLIIELPCSFLKGAKNE